jgi:hypothetical protein
MLLQVPSVKHATATNTAAATFMLSLWETMETKATAQEKPA